LHIGCGIIFFKKALFYPFPENYFLSRLLLFLVSISGFFGQKMPWSALRGLFKNAGVS
jgi:hypothetical protein